PWRSPSSLLTHETRLITVRAHLVQRDDRICDAHRTIWWPRAPRLARDPARRPVVLLAVELAVRIEIRAVLGAHRVGARRVRCARPDVRHDCDYVPNVDHLVVRAARIRRQ